MNSQRKPSRQDILRRQQQSTFVGREDQLTSFRHNLTLSPEDWRFLFNVSGQGGVGKSTLIRQFRKIAEEAGFITAYTSESENSVPEVMGRLAEQLEQQGYKLNQFSERYRVYRQKKQELEADPDAPQGFSTFLGRSLAKAGLGLARQVPGSGAVTSFLDEEMIAAQAGEWSSFMAKKLGNKDEVRLVREPVEILTPLFLQDVNRIAEKRNLSLFFDTYERTSDFLDDWIREILEGRHGDLPVNVIVTIAGREELRRNDWADYEGAITRLPLKPFIEDEARQYLVQKGVNNPQVIDVILRLSGQLPLLVATLATESPIDPNRIGDPSGTAVERFLRWVDNPKHRQVALDAALPRCLNRDIIAVLHGEEDADELFNWLKQMPFVEERPNGWAYHDIARIQMLRHKRLTSPQGWADIHGKLAAYYDNLRMELQLDKETQWRNSDWQTYSSQVLYHQLCQSLQRNLSKALNEFLTALKNQAYARNWTRITHNWAEIATQVGRDTEATALQCWGERLTEGLIAFDEKCYESSTAMLMMLMEEAGIEPQRHPVAIGLRGYTYHLMERYEDALKDFDRAIELDPNYVWIIASRGMSYHLMERYEDALKDFDRVIELDSNYAWIIASRGINYTLMERYEDALKDLDRAIELESNCTWIIASRGVNYRLMKHYEDALEDFDRAIELDPSNASLYSRRGEVYTLMRLYEKAFQDYENAIRLDPSDDWATACRGAIRIVFGQADNAKADINRAIELSKRIYAYNPEDHRNTFKLATYYLAISDINEAKHFYRDALRKGAPIPSIREATRSLEGFLSIFPNHEWAKKVKAALEQKLVGE